MEIIVEDTNAKLYKVVTIRYEHFLKCEAYRSIHWGDEYEKEPFTNFAITSDACYLDNKFDIFAVTDECDLDNESDIVEYLQDCFYDKLFLEAIGVLGKADDEEIWTAPHAKKVLEKYYALDLEHMGSVKGLKLLSEVAAEMAEIIESKFDYVELH